MRVLISVCVTYVHVHIHAYIDTNVRMYPVSECDHAPSSLPNYSLASLAATPHSPPPSPPAPPQMEQELWAVDLDIGMSDMQAMSGLLGQVTAGSYCWDKGLFGIPGQGERMGEEVRVCVCVSSSLFLP